MEEIKIRPRPGWTATAEPRPWTSGIEPVYYRSRLLAWIHFMFSQELVDSIRIVSVDTKLA